jgi:hypothetical protein
MPSDEPANVHELLVHLPLWGSQPNGGEGKDVEEVDWEEYELEEPSDEDDELDDEEIEEWGEDEE